MNEHILLAQTVVLEIESGNVIASACEASQCELADGSKNQLDVASVQILNLSPTAVERTGRTTHLTREQFLDARQTAQRAKAIRAAAPRLGHITI
jgi:hypothetical protein